MWSNAAMLAPDPGHHSNRQPHRARNRTIACALSEPLCSSSSWSTLQVDGVVQLIARLCSLTIRRTPSRSGSGKAIALAGGHVIRRSKLCPSVDSCDSRRGALTGDGSTAQCRFSCLHCPSRRRSAACAHAALQQMDARLLCALMAAVGRRRSLRAGTAWLLRHRARNASQGDGSECGSACHSKSRTGRCCALGATSCRLAGPSCR